MLLLVKGKQFVKKLKRAGCEVNEKRGKGGHVIVSHGERWTTVPIHGDADLGPDFLRKICKQLGLQPEDVL